jgi:hypothetical protein
MRFGNLHDSARGIQLLARPRTISHLASFGIKKRLYYCWLFVKNIATVESITAPGRLSGSPATPKARVNRSQSSIAAFLVETIQQLLIHGVV